MTLANCRAPFREPAADELGRQHPIIAAQREEEGKKGRKESAIIGTSSAARHRAAIFKQTRFAWPRSCSQHPGHDSSHLFLNSPLPISAPHPSSLPPRDRLLHPTDAPRASTPAASSAPALAATNTPPGRPSWEAVMLLYTPSPISLAPTFSSKSCSRLQNLSLVY